MANPSYPGLESLNKFLWDLRTRLVAGERPDQVSGPFGVHGIMYGNDDYDGGGEFASVGFTLPDEIYAEIEDGTYGQLNAFRIYLDSGE